MIKLVLLRHGESVWNLENRFTGWTDVMLSENGKKEAQQAGILLKNFGLIFNIGFTSVLTRAIDTINIVKNQLNQQFDVFEDWRLNERHYGALQGLNKSETAKKYGDEQVKLWRRSANVRPPLLLENDSRNPKFEKIYSGIKNLPLGESLQDTRKRVVEFYETFAKTKMMSNSTVLMVAHGNSLRALIQHLDNVSDDDIVNLEIPTGKPIVYELTDNFKIIKHFYLE